MTGLTLCEPLGKGGSPMQVFVAVKIWLDYHKTNPRDKTVRTYRTILTKFGEKSVGNMLSFPH
jgi:hypothetical protein